MSYIEVSFSPLIFSGQTYSSPFTVVVVDILRATTSIVRAFESGVEKIIPVASEKELKAWKARGYEVAGERGGIKPDYADYSDAFAIQGDAARVSVQMWERAQHHVLDCLEGASHLERLKKINQDKDLEYAFAENTANAVPYYDYGCHCLRAVSLNK